MRDLLVGAVVPHAPLLVEGVAGPRIREQTHAVRSALDSLDLGSPDMIVVLSPHARTARVYAEVAGDLSGFGIDDIAIERKTDATITDELARRCGWPEVHDPIDFGVVVALATLDVPDVPVVAIGLRETTGPDASSAECGVDDGRRIAGALKALGRDRNVAVIASAHGSAALNDRAPLTRRPEGEDLERSLIDALTDDVGRIDEIPSERFAAGGACGIGPLVAMSRLFRGRSSQVLAHESPFGVGYIVASIA